MAMELHICVIVNADIFCRYENGFGVYFNWILQFIALCKVGTFRLNEDYQLRKEG